MTHPELLKHLEELGEEAEILLLEPRADYDRFIMGIAERGAEIVALYDKPALIDWLTEVARADSGAEDGDVDPEAEALGHFDFNMSQGLPGYPLFVDTMVDRPIDAP